MIERWLYTAESLEGGYGKQNEGMERTNDLEEAVLRSSEVKGGETGIGWLDNQHAPAIDIDMHCELVPSSTEDHFHLYIDKVMSWDNYLKLLTVMNEVGIVQDGFLKLAKRSKATFLRVRDKSEDPKPQEKKGAITPNTDGWTTHYPCQIEECDVCIDIFHDSYGLSPNQVGFLWNIKFGDNPFGGANKTIPWKYEVGVLTFDVPDGMLEEDDPF